MTDEKQCKTSSGKPEDHLDPIHCQCGKSWCCSECGTGTGSMQCECTPAQIMNVKEDRSG